MHLLNGISLNCKALVLSSKLHETRPTSCHSASRGQRMLFLHVPVNFCCHSGGKELEIRRNLKLPQIFDASAHHSLNFLSFPLLLLLSSAFLVFLLILAYLHYYFLSTTLHCMVIKTIDTACERSKGSVRD